MFVCFSPLAAGLILGRQQSEAPYPHIRLPTSAKRPPYPQLQPSPSLMANCARPASMAQSQRQHQTPIQIPHAGHRAAPALRQQPRASTQRVLKLRVHADVNWWVLIPVVSINFTAAFEFCQWRISLLYQESLSVWRLCLLLTRVGWCAHLPHLPSANTPPPSSHCSHSPFPPAYLPCRDAFRPRNAAPRQPAQRYLPAASLHAPVIQTDFLVLGSGIAGGVSGAWTGVNKI